MERGVKVVYEAVACVFASEAQEHVPPGLDASELEMALSL